MEYGKLKAAAESVRMPGEMKRRILRNCKEELMNSGKESVMKHIRMRKTAAVALALAVCLSLTVAAVAAPKALKGFFRDVTDWRGAVVGTAYEQATDEIRVEAAVTGEELTVQVTFADPQMAPYRYVEQLGIAEYKIVNENGKTVKEGAAESVEVVNGQTAIPIPLDGLDSGSYKLTVTAFVADSKAEQPLPISGNWEAEFIK